MRHIAIYSPNVRHKNFKGDKKYYLQLLPNRNLMKAAIKKQMGNTGLYGMILIGSPVLYAVVAGGVVEKKMFLLNPAKKKVALHFYSRAKDADKLDFAMYFLKKAMVWDEKRSYLEYDLDFYMVMVVDGFNMSAMENKWLNLFNTQFVLAIPRTTTDRGSADVQAVIAHEYFHNYTGNRVTCRDWFQLTLKEGLTVFREQEFLLI